MTLLQMLMIGLFAIGMTLALLGLLQASGAMSRVPVRVPLIAVASACLAATGAQGVLSNIAAVDEAREKRAGDVALSIAAKATLGTGDDPFLDVSAAGNWDDPEISAAIASGDSVEISAVSGTPATLRLGSLSEGSYRAVLTYNGFQYTVFEGAATVENSRGFPQILRLEQLPPL